MYWNNGIDGTRSKDWSISIVLTLKLWKCKRCSWPCKTNWIEWPVQHFSKYIKKFHSAQTLIASRGKKDLLDFYPMKHRCVMINSYNMLHILITYIQAVNKFRSKATSLLLVLWFIVVYLRELQFEHCNSSIFLGYDGVLLHDSFRQCCHCQSHHIIFCWVWQGTDPVSGISKCFNSWFWFNLILFI